MPRYNIIIPDHLVEQWEAIQNRSRWVQEKLEDEYKELAKKAKEAKVDA